MLEARNIIYFTPFYFPNGNPAKNKYFVVLKRIEDKTIIVSLPTSKDHIPANIEQKDGCIEIPEIHIGYISKRICKNAYFFIRLSKVLGSNKLINTK